MLGGVTTRGYISIATAASVVVLIQLAREFLSFPANPLAHWIILLTWAVGAIAALKIAQFRDVEAGLVGLLVIGSADLVMRLAQSLSTPEVHWFWAAVVVTSWMCVGLTSSESKRFAAISFAALSAVMFVMARWVPGDLGYGFMTTAVASSFAAVVFILVLSYALLRGALEGRSFSGRRR